MASLDSRGENVPANIYICSFSLFVLPPLFDKYSGCYGNGLIDVTE